MKAPMAKSRPKGEKPSSAGSQASRTESQASQLPPDTQEPLTSLCASEGPSQHAQSSRAGQNLAAAIAQHGNDEIEVKTFLSGLGLDRYMGIFLDNGFDCMDVVEEMEESHMKELGMAAGHIIKLSKKLNEKRQAQAPAKTEGS